MTPATRYAPYHWARHATRIGYDEPGCTYITNPTVSYDVLHADDMRDNPLFLEGFWSRLYGPDPNLKAQEN